MNLKEFFNGLMGILHIFGGGDTGGANLTTYEPFRTTYAPVIVDTSTLANITSGNDRTVSPKFTFHTSTSYETTDENLERKKTSLVSGETAETEIQISTKMTPDTTSGSTGQSNATTLGPKTESTINTKDLSTVTGSGTTITGKTGSGSTVTGKTSSGSTVTEKPGTGSTVTGETGTGSTVTGETGTGSTVTGKTGSGSTVTGKTGSGSTVTGKTGSGSTVTGKTGSGSTVTGKTGTGSTVTGKTGSGSTVTGSIVTSESGSTASHGTDVPPTAEPSGLSRGAVAGIVIGCLLLVAVVAAAIVFFVKNRNTSPEHQRLRV